jgi:glycosyltransferase involved in cell wall biosynthesis
VKLIKPKYSIIIPARNGIQYLPSCIESIIMQSYVDYELIVSDDHSEDGTRDYLDKLSHANLQVISPEVSLSMTEHWEWALSHARGEWLIFVGQDDGLQPYFFKLADNLTRIASEKKLRVIASTRALFFWPGCEAMYGDTAVSYSARDKVSVLNSRIEATKALFGRTHYFVLPAMYTTSLFHNSLLEEARGKQEGKVFNCHPQDANLAVIACSLESHYLNSEIPLGWVGSSPKSAGMAMIESKNKNIKDIKNLREEYLQKIRESSMSYHKLAGKFTYGDPAVYFWQAFLKTERLRGIPANNLFTSRIFKIIFFTTVAIRAVIKNYDGDRRLYFKDILRTNDISYFFIYILTYVLLVPTYIYKSLHLFYKAFSKIYTIAEGKGLKIRINWPNESVVSVFDASQMVAKKMSLKTKQWKLLKES